MHPRWARGWIPFPRLAYNPGEVGGSPFWHERRSYSRHEAWEYLWVLAAHGPHPFAIPGSSQVVELRTGETPPLAVRRLMQVWGWKSKRKVEDFLFTLQELGEIAKGQRTKFGDTYVFVGASPRKDQGDATGTQPGRNRDAGGTMDNDLMKGKNTSPPSGEKRARTRGSRFVPENWTPANEARLREIAAAQGADFDHEMRKMRDHEFNRAYTDWDKVAANWMRNATPNGKGRSPQRADTNDVPAYVPPPAYF